MRKKAIMAATILVPLLISTLAMVQIVDLAKAESPTIIVPDNYPTIQAAINNASEGDTIYVKKGVYVENPVVNKSISLIGEDRDATIIDVTAGLAVESDSVTLSGFTIYDGRRGISLSGNHCSISGNKITDSTNGIVLFGCEKNSITGNTFKSIGLSSAIQLNFANRNLVNNNLIDSCVEGIQIWQNSNNNMISENRITNCEDHAIRFQYSNDNTVTRNSITNSGCGTSIYGSNRNTISENNYSHNTVQFSANEDYYLTFGYNRSVNTIKENFWSDYIGRDTNGDGFGDLPYIIDAFNKDNYPLMRPVSIPTPTPSPSPTQQPAVSILYPLNNSFFNVSLGGVSYQLVYETNTVLSWVGYSIGGKGYSVEGRGSGHVTVTNNSTIVHDLGTSGYHTLTLYANDTLGNWAIPQTVTYLVNFYPDYPPTPSPSPSPIIEPSPSIPEFPSVDVVLAVVAVAAGALVYFKKRKS